MASSKKRSKPNKKRITQAIATELTERAKSEAASQKQFLRSHARGKLESLIPRELQWILPFVENFRRDREPPEPEQEDLQETQLAPPQLTPIPHGTETLYRQYRCWSGDPLSCHFPQQTLQQDAKAIFCHECGFPVPLLAASEIRGSRGRYRVEGLLRRRGMGRLYQGTQVSNDQPVVIKEYLLPMRGFNEQEIRQRKTAFGRLAGISSVDGRIQDYRLIAPWEAIADQTLERCYLITKGTLDTYPTLREYRARSGALSNVAVRHVLNQVLQTLEFLHGQKIRLPSGQVQPGIAHGNLSLDSLLIAEHSLGAEQTSLTNGAAAASLPPSMATTHFHIYVCDLDLWESLFELSTATPRQPSLAQDLVDLGYVAFYLLANRSEPSLNPQDDRHWEHVDPALKGLIWRLMAIDTPFESAEAARQALLKLPQQTRQVGAIERLEAEADEPVRSPRLLWWLYGLLGLALLASLLGWLLPKSQPRIAHSDPLLCQLSEVSGVPRGEFTYTGESTGIWNYVLKQDLVAAGSTVATDQPSICGTKLQQQAALPPQPTLEQVLQVRQPKLQLNYRPESSVQQALTKVQTEQRDFAIASSIEDIPITLAQTEIAYDGIAVFVSFSYARRENSLPQRLRGQITFEQLQRLYTGQVKNWRSLDRNLPNLDVRLYVPKEPEAVRVFEERVLKTERNKALFRDLLQTGQISQRETFQTLREVIQEFEVDDRNAGIPVGAIAFGPLSKVFGQCSVYPLAIAASDRTPAVQALIQDSGKPIDPTTDLCRNKGSYQPRVQGFKTRQYPLAYSIAVVYPRDNSRPPAGEKFGNLLRTEEGQRLLQQTGLIPLAEL